MATTQQRIRRTPANQMTVRLAQEVAGAARWLSKVLEEADLEEDQDALQEHLRYELLRLEEAAASGRFGR